MLENINLIKLRNLDKVTTFDKKIPITKLYSYVYEIITLTQFVNYQKYYINKGTPTIRTLVLADSYS